MSANSDGIQMILPVSRAETVEKLGFSTVSRLKLQFQSKGMYRAYARIHPNGTKVPTGETFVPTGIKTHAHSPGYFLLPLRGNSPCVAGFYEAVALCPYSAAVRRLNESYCGTPQYSILCAPAARKLFRQAKHRKGSSLSSVCMLNTFVCAETVYFPSGAFFSQACRPQQPRRGQAACRSHT